MEEQKSGKERTTNTRFQLRSQDNVKGSASRFATLIPDEDEEEFQVMDEEGLIENETGKGKQVTAS